MGADPGRIALAADQRVPLDLRAAPSAVDLDAVRESRRGRGGGDEGAAGAAGAAREGERQGTGAGAVRSPADRL
ncbi:MAG TPA: hypothetical protein VGG06_36425 [Thermoanaerobaculia bacterium]